MKSRTGQTLIEVMIALFALTAGFLGIMALLNQSLGLSKSVSNQAVATYLAAEGVELAKNVIDHDVYQHLDQAIRGSGWGTAFGPSGGAFELDYAACGNLNSQVAPCNPSPYLDRFLNFDQNSGLYGYAAGSPTIFKRKISVASNPSNPDEIAVVSCVFWSGANCDAADQRVVLEDHFYKWQPGS